MKAAPLRASARLDARGRQPKEAHAVLIGSAGDIRLCRLAAMRCAHDLQHAADVAWLTSILDTRIRPPALLLRLGQWLARRRRRERADVRVPSVRALDRAPGGVSFQMQGLERDL